MIWWFFPSPSWIAWMLIAIGLESPNTPRANPWRPFITFSLYYSNFLRGVWVMPQPILYCFKRVCLDIIMIPHLCSNSLLWFETTYLNRLIVYSIVFHISKVACVGPLGVLYTKWRLVFTLDCYIINYNAIKCNQLALCLWNTRSSNRITTSKSFEKSKIEDLLPLISQK